MKNQNFSMFSQKATTAPSTVKIYDHFPGSNKSKLYQGLSPMPKLSAQTLDIHKMYRRTAQKQSGTNEFNHTKRHLMCTTELKDYELSPQVAIKRNDSMPQPRHAIFDAVQIEIGKLNKAIAGFSQQNMYSPVAKPSYYSILSEVKPMKVARFQQATITNRASETTGPLSQTLHLDRKSTSIFSNAYIDERALSPQRLISSKSIRVKSVGGAKSLKQAISRRVQSSQKQESQAFVNEPLIFDNGYQAVKTPLKEVKTIVQSSSGVGQVSQSDYLDAKPGKRNNSLTQIPNKVTDTNSLTSHANTQEEPSIVPIPTTAIDQSQAKLIQQYRRKSVKYGRYSAQVLKKELPIGSFYQNQLIRTAQPNRKSVKSTNIDQMIEYVTTAHQAQFEKHNDDTHLLKQRLDSPPQPVNLMLNNFKVNEKQIKKTKQKTPVKCQAHHHSPAKKTHLGLQQNELILVSKPEEEPPFFNILIEQRHATQLSKKNLDDESRLEVIYRVLKDQLRRAKKDLLQIKIDKKSQQQSALELKKSILIAKERASKRNDISGKIVEVNDLKGNLQLEVSADVDPSLRRVVNHLISTDVRKHNRYCPCCKNYDEGADLSLNQMGEFLEYIRQLHNKLAGDPNKNRKKGRPKEYVLEHDSVSDITDLSERGILTTSMDQLSPEERKKLDLYMRQMRQLQQANPPKHNCLNVKKSLENTRLVVEMQLRGVQRQLDKTDEENNAHQFSYRSIQLQADDNERAEIEIQTALIDLKSKNADIDIYDLSRAEKQPVSPRIGFKQTAEKQTGTGESKVKLIAPQDWYFSELNRRLMREFYQKNGLEFSAEVLDSFHSYDEHHVNLKLTPIVNANKVLRSSQQPLKSIKKSSTADSRSNPQESALSLVKVLCEPEITYLTSMMKQSTEKWSQFEVLKELHSKSTLTAKTLTKELIEGKTPIGLIINNHRTVEKESVVTLLYRCEKLFQARSDVQKILMLLLKLNNAPNSTTRTPQEHQQLVQRLKGLVGQFKTEYRMYDQCFIYKGQDVDNLAEKEKDEEFEAASSRSQYEKDDDRKIQGILKTEARYEGAIGLHKGQKTEIQIVDRIADEVQSKSHSITSKDNILLRSSINSTFLDKVKDELYLSRHSVNENMQQASEGSDSQFQLQVVDYFKNGVRINRVALVGTMPYEDEKTAKKRRHQSRQLKSSPHQTLI